MAVWSAVPLSELGGRFRLDSEFWEPEFIKNEKRILAVPSCSLGDLVYTIRKGIFYILASEYTDDGVPMLRASNVGHILPRDNECVFISEARHATEAKTSLTRGDVILSKTGLEGASVILADECNISQDVVGIRVRRDKVNPYFLATFLNARPGVLQMRRWFQGQVQMHLTLEDARRIIVPLPPLDTQRAIETLVLRAYQRREDSKRLYSQAQEALLSMLSVDESTFIDSLYYERPHSETTHAKRLDAEFFQPKHLRALRVLTAKEHRPLGEIAKLHKGVQARSIGPISATPFISIKDLVSFVSEVTETTVETEVALAPPWSVLLAITGATIGKTALNAENEPVAISGDVLALESVRVPPGYLQVVIDSPMIYSLCSQYTTGATNGHLSPRAVAEFPIPLLTGSATSKISKLVMDAIQTLQESKRLLAEAIKTVEDFVAGAQA